MLEIGFVQMEPKLYEKDKNLSEAQSYLRNFDGDLVVLPELFDTGYNFHDKESAYEVSSPIPGGETTQLLSNIAEDKGIYIVAGTSEKDGEDLYNSAVIVGPKGYVGKYRKIHLFFKEKKIFEPGEDGFKVFDFGDFKLGIMVCFDWYFPESIRTLALKGADVVAHPSNLVLPYAPRAMPIRSLENKVFSITSNRVGVERDLEFIGNSLISDPSADKLVVLEDGVGVKSVKIDVSKARDKSINELNNIFDDRKPQFYD